MPVDMRRYPPDWKRISAYIRDRSGGHCECQGECGLHRGRRCQERNGQPAQWARGKVVLTVAHLGVAKADGPGDPHDKMDCREENLKAMCQRCHLRYDHHEHQTNARRTRNTKRLATQSALPGIE